MLFPSVDWKIKNWHPEVMELVRALAKVFSCRTRRLQLFGVHSHTEGFSLKIESPSFPLMPFPILGKIYTLRTDDPYPKTTTPYVNSVRWNAITCPLKHILQSELEKVNWSITVSDTRTWVWTSGSPCTDVDYTSSCTFKVLRSRLLVPNIEFDLQWSCAHHSWIASQATH